MVFPKHTYGTLLVSFQTDVNVLPSPANLTRRLEASILTAQGPTLVLLNTVVYSTACLTD